MKARVRTYLLEYTRLVWLTLLLQIILRAVEYWAFSDWYQKDLSLEILFTRSINLDSLFVVLWSFYLSPIFMAGCFLSLTLTRWIFRGLAFSYFLFTLVATVYFLIAQTLLTGAVGSLSAEELIRVLAAELSLNRLPELFIFVTFMVIAVLSYFYRKAIRAKEISYLSLSIYLLLAIVAVGNRDYQFKKLKYFDSVFDFQIGNNKWVYLSESIRDQETSEAGFSPFELSERIPRYQKHFEHFDFSGSLFPFVHQEPYNNVLGPYFSKSVKKPNIVLVVTESLSASFVGSESMVGSLMPYTDSLLQEGLYWSNFLSVAERSYGALPALLASSPAGVHERGFVGMSLPLKSQLRYPRQTSLIDLLEGNGYSTHFYYGGWIYFDNIGYYLEQLGMDQLISDPDFDPEIYHKNDGSTNKMVWGYHDRDLFHLSLEKMKNYPTGQPYLNVYQTLSIHSPFNLAPEEYYEADFQQSRLAALTNIKQDQVAHIPSPTLASIFLADDALRFFMDSYRQRADFDETIFIITGDHAIDLGFDSGPFKNYRIPLLIYSPMLKRKGQFKSLHSQLDVLPSLLALLEGTYDLSFPQEKPWIGSGLDTLSDFHSERMTPLNIQAMELPNFVWRDQAIWGEEVYRLNENLELSLEQEESRIKETQEAFSLYKYVNRYACFEDKIWPTPDSIKSTN